MDVIDQTLTQQSMAAGVVAGVDLSPKLWLTPGLPKDILFLFGGWTAGANNNLFTYNCRADRWRVISKQYAASRAYHGAAMIDQCIYFVGGFDRCDCYHPTVVCLDVPLARRSARASKAFARCYVSVTVLQGHIYAMEDFHGHTLTNTVKRYDVETNRWSMVASMNDVRSDASAAVAAGRIYIILSIGLRHISVVRRGAARSTLANCKPAVAFPETVNRDALQATAVLNVVK
ncbi:kelch-like protein 10 [Dermacentor albipictus]|uniref:kelch-like protein 10 n=1 Tax=Dermacentor albipictus TaxID=60249 RepID=UPI0038FC1E33